MDRLEYIMWRDTIRYKYQLDKTSQLSEQEIEEKIDELERTMGESMPYFFEGKDSEEIRTIVDHNMGFPTCDDLFVVTEDECIKWRRGEEAILFCGYAGHNACRLNADKLSPDGDGLISASELGREKYRILVRKLREFNSQFSGFNCPLQTFESIIEKFRKIEYYNNVDFTNLTSIKELFRENYIYTYKEFNEQNGYGRCMPRDFRLSNGQVVTVFKVHKTDLNYYD